MSAYRVSQFGTIPKAQPLTDDVIDEINSAREPGVMYRFTLYRPIPCEKCGHEGSPFMRFSRSIPSEAWIYGQPLTNEGEVDPSKDSIICPILASDPRLDVEAAKTLEARLLAIVDVLAIST